MVNIKLDNEWSIQSDSHQYILTQNNRYITFHSTLENAITSWFEKKIRTSEVTTIQSLLNYHKSVLNALQQVLTPFKIKVIQEK